MSDLWAPLMASLNGKSQAVISPDGVYRYSLTRTWSDGPKRVLWIMLNPSTADAHVNDPTIRRCISFSAEWGFDSLEVVNLFALRATNPKALWPHPDPVGPDNMAHIGEGIIRADRIIAAWGANAYKKGALPVVRSVCQALGGRRVECLGVTAQFAPRHPLYIRGDQQLEVFLDGTAA